MVVAMPSLPGLQQVPGDNLILLMMAWVAFAIVMFMMRPRSLRNKSDTDYRNNEGDDGRPPMPPAVN
ncbi:hypothetical protein J6590_104806 [Homalodisca vitripennis]|nr:hypothetical protein J6590_104806 [Homalodisca vitripennis]